MASKKLLVDADAFVALVNSIDSNHQKAKLLRDQISDQEFSLMTSDPAFGEAITVISQDTGLESATLFAEETLVSQVEIIEVDASLRRKALDIFKKQTSKNSRFTDCINMAIMEEKKLNTIFSFDVQYKKNKFKRFGIDK
ncbi:PIN domain-containing protein [Candidatus Daviesbacteria bacterium]|nr:PIN domain-containing protein [Candidatus Daviesbacteria bacterium]